MHLMRKCPCPVWAIKSTSDVTFPRILVAVDPDPEEKENIVLNKRIIEMSASLAEMQKSELHIVHAWDLYEKSMTISKHTMDKINEEVKTMHKIWFEGLLRKHNIDLPETQVHLIKGEASIQIPRFVREKDIDLIVMGTVSRTGIPGFFIGNTAEKILYRVDCSVLAVKPDSFVSPVEVP